MFEVDEPVVAPEVYLDWLIVQHTCEWCGGDIEWRNAASLRVPKPPEWLCRVEKRSGYVSKHWRLWRVCQACHLKGLIGTPEHFSKWIFPVIHNMSMIGDSLAALMQVQPMSEPRGEIFYADVVDRPLRGRRREGVVLDDAAFPLDLYVNTRLPARVDLRYRLTHAGVVKA